MDIIVLYPKGRCTKVQELHMITVMDKNVHVFRGMLFLSNLFAIFLIKINS